MSSKHNEAPGEEIDERLNPSTSSFDSTSALYSRRPFFPVPSAPVFDNLSRFETSPEGEVRIKDVKKQSKKPGQPPVDILPTISTDGWDNVINRMKLVEGPMAVLKSCIDSRTQIKVITRGAFDVRGEVIGYLTAFDKMWNLAMEEVTETWTRKKKRKCFIGGEPVTQGILTNPYRMITPTIHVSEIDKTTEKCQRQVDKMLLRGEHVVLISLISSRLKDLRKK